MHTALLLEMIAEAAGERTAIGSRPGGVTYAGLLARARAAGAWMAGAPAKHVVYVGLNSPLFPVALFGASLANRPFAPLNYRLPDEDLRRIIARTAPSVAIVDDDLAARVAGVEGVRVTTGSEFQALIAAADPAATAAGSRATEPSAAEPWAVEPPDPEAIALLLFTSGTTGAPKAAILRHRHLSSYVISSVEFLGAGEEEATLVSVPPYHIAGVSAVLTSTYLGRRLVQLGAFTPEDWVRAAREERVTHAMMVPTMVGRVLEVLEASGERLPSLRHVSYGGGRMPAPTIERALRLLPQVDFVNAYGLTETSSTIAVLTPEDHRQALASSDPKVRAQLGSVGRPLPTLELQIRDADGNPSPPGEEGEIWVRGEQISGEYLHAKALREDGWFPTNDCGWLDEHGFLYVGGRLDDVIVRGGENISPGEVEDVLRQHPAVKDCAVIGLPDDEWGERIVAIVVAHETEPHPQDLRQWVRERLRSTRTPEEIFYSKALPYTETGKLLRRTLKQQHTRNR